MENEADILANRGKTGQVFWTFASGDEAVLKRIYKRMTGEEFIEVLDEKGYSYEIEGDKIVVTHGRGVWLDSLKTIPSGVKFKNRGGVDLDSLKTLSPGVEFKNGGTVWLKSLVGDMFSNWSGNIEGINSKRLLNVMISKGIFER